MQLEWDARNLGGGDGSDPFTRPSILFIDLVKRLLARRWTRQMLGVKGSQVQILSARHDKGPLKQGYKSCSAALSYSLA